eukprot:6198918-Pleurochrysis_carterae.AAC.2
MQALYCEFSVSTSIDALGAGAVPLTVDILDSYVLSGCVFDARSYFQRLTQAALLSGCSLLRDKFRTSSNRLPRVTCASHIAVESH